MGRFHSLCLSRYNYCLRYTYGLNKTLHEKEIISLLRIEKIYSIFKVGLDLKHAFSIAATFKQFKNFFFFKF